MKININSKRRYTILFVLCICLFCTSCAKQVTSNDEAIHILKKHLEIEDKDEEGISFIITENEDAYIIQLLVDEFIKQGGSGSAGSYQILKDDGTVTLIN